jgi:hypothetical protein
MGLVTGLLTLPLAPVRGTMWIAERLREQAEQELDPEERLRRRLEELAVAHELGELTDEEYEEAEAELLAALDEPHEPPATERPQEVRDDGSDGAAAEARGRA